MNPVAARFPFPRTLLVLAGVALLAACAPQAAAPTAAPAKPAPTVAPAKPAPTAAPAKAEAPASKPAATAAPAAKPTEKPAAKAPEFDEKAVADFYKGKTVRIVVGYAPGGTTDVSARLLQKVFSKYIPGNPSVVVENKPGGGSMLALNTVYNSEPKDGTVIVAFSSDLVLLQAIGAPGVQFDSAKLNWLGSPSATVGTCAARVDSGLTRIEAVMGEGGKEMTLASYGKGTGSYNPPAVMNAVLGTKFKIVTGYEGGAGQRLAVKNKEVQGWCTIFETITGPTREMFEGSNPEAKVIIITGDKTFDHPSFKGVPAAETLAKTDEARTLLRAVHVPFGIQLPYGVAPEVPKDRIQALRRAHDKAYADPELLDAAVKGDFTVRLTTGEEVTRTVQTMLDMSPATRAKLKEILE